MLVAGRLSLLKSVQFVVFHVRYGVCSEEFGLSDAAAGKKVDSAMLLLGTTRVDWEMVKPVVGHRCQAVSWGVSLHIVST